MNTNRFELVDFLKGFSISTIVMMHLLNDYSTGLLSKALSFGGAGVHVFILCSGFGLYLSYQRKSLTYPQFLKRRFKKVYIPYVIVIFVSALIPFFYTAADKWQCVASHVFLYKMFCPQWEESFGSQMWFVSTIMQFYLCWPLIVRLMRHRGGYAMRCSSVFCGQHLSQWSAKMMKECGGLSSCNIFGSFF